MLKSSLDSLGELQRAVIEVVWDLGQASVHEVRDHLKRDKRPAYTTVLTALQKLEKAGWLRHRAAGKSYTYLPTRSREQAGAGSVQRFVKQVFDGDPMRMFQHLISEGSLSDRDLVELRKMIDRTRKERQR
ncbi:BlaI/MecI/CopY family transcriptional regulator [Planctomycetota bacterium]